MKKYYSIFLIIILSVTLIGCNNKNVDRLVISEKSLPSNFDEIAFKRVESPHFQYLVERVDNQTKLENNWDLFRLQNKMPTVNFEEIELFFIGIQESGSCPYNIEDLNINSENKEMTIKLSKPRRACTDDAVPRTFVVKIDRIISNNLTNVMILQEGISTTIPIDKQSE